MGARILGIVASIVLVGCQYDPFTEVYTTKQPKAEDLVGLYVPSEETKAFIANEGHYSPAESSITFSADGSVSMTNIPDWWLTPVWRIPRRVPFLPRSLDRAEASGLVGRWRQFGRRYWD